MLEQIRAIANLTQSFQRQHKYNGILADRCNLSVAAHESSLSITLFAIQCHSYK